MYNKEIDQICDAWKKACETYPNQRPGQLFYNAVGDPFYSRSGEIVQSLEEYAADAEPK